MYGKKACKVAWKRVWKRSLPPSWPNSRISSGTPQQLPNLSSGALGCPRRPPWKMSSNTGKTDMNTPLPFRQGGFSDKGNGHPLRDDHFLATSSITGFLRRVSNACRKSPPIDVSFNPMAWLKNASRFVKWAGIRIVCI